MRYFEIVHIHHRNNLATEKNLRRFCGEAGITHAVLQPIEPMRKTEDNLALCAAGKTGGGNLQLWTFASVDPRDPERLNKLKSYMERGCLGL